ncbi:hypothetical protein [Alkalicoccus urumqiensis]|uniref:hypothetical protein n=1 Tax=Alkalicoccus urumqiensis TaxID=1548213 RepID=UPI00115B870F|nr:hypothetical protein [Alkalicoccus urumqiensis]
MKVLKVRLILKEKELLYMDPLPACSCSRTCSGGSRSVKAQPAAESYFRAGLSHNGRCQSSNCPFQSNNEAFHSHFPVIV